MFKKRELAVAMALALSLPQVGLGQTTSGAPTAGPVTSSSAEDADKSVPVEPAPEAGKIAGMDAATAIAVGVLFLLSMIKN